MRTRAKPNTDNMVARKIEDNNSLGFWTDRTDVGGVNEVEDEPEAFEGYFFKETTIPRLGSSQLKAVWYGKPYLPQLCEAEGSGEMKQYTLSRA